MSEGRPRPAEESGIETTEVPEVPIARKAGAALQSEDSLEMTGMGVGSPASEEREAGEAEKAGKFGGSPSPGSADSTPTLAPKMDKKVRLLGYGNVHAAIWYLAIPCCICNAVSTLMSTIDGKLAAGKVGQEALTAESNFLPLEMITTIYVTISFACGATSFISPLLGNGNVREAKRYATYFVILSLVWSTLVPIIFLPWLDTLLRLLGCTTPNMLMYGRQYAIPMLSVGAYFSTFSMSTGHLLRCQNRAMLAMARQLTQSAIQIVFLCIFYYGIVDGLGIVQMYTTSAASLIASAIVAVWLILALTNTRVGKLQAHFTVTIDFRVVKPFDWKIVWRLILYGIPDFASYVQTGVAILCGVGILAKKGGDDAIVLMTAFGLQYRFSPFLLVPTQSFSQAFGPIFGYALGTHNYKRAMETMTATLFWMTSITLLIYIPYMTCHRYIAEFLIQDERSRQELSSALLLGTAILPLVPCFLIVNDVNQMEHRSMLAIGVQLSRTAIVIIAEYALVYGTGNPHSIFYSFMVGDIIGSIFGIICFICFYVKYYRLWKKQQAMENEMGAEAAANLRPHDFGIKPTKFAPPMELTGPPADPTHGVAPPRAGNPDSPGVADSKVSMLGSSTLNEPIEMRPVQSTQRLQQPAGSEYDASTDQLVITEAPVTPPARERSGLTREAPAE